MILLAKRFLQHVLPGVIRPLHVLWNQLIAFTFFILAVMAVPAAYRAIRDFDGEPRSLFRIAVATAFSLIMIYFSVASFFKARKISRS